MGLDKLDAASLREFLADGSHPIGEIRGEPMRAIEVHVMAGDTFDFAAMLTFLRTQGLGQTEGRQRATMRLVPRGEFVTMQVEFEC